VSQLKGASRSGPNPQGKGVVPVLRDFGALLPAVGGPKAPGDFLRDYCISSLVLAADFRFKPVVGKTYFLYATDEGWNLSMIAPDEWGGNKGEAFMASCHLRPDMTWELHSLELEDNSPVLARARRFVQGFVDTLSGQESIRRHLPFFERGLPYYRRLLATALAASLEKSMPGTGDDVKALLDDTSGVAPGRDRDLLPAPRGRAATRERN